MIIIQVLHKYFLTGFSYNMVASCRHIVLLGNQVCRLQLYSYVCTFYLMSQRKFLFYHLLICLSGCCPS